MDTVWVANTSLWVSFGVGIVLLVPIILEFSKRNLPVLFGVVAFVLVIRGMSPHSPEIQTVWQQMAQVPQAMYAFIRQMLP